MSSIQTDLRPFCRLNKNIVPINYDLTIYPNFESSQFSGTVKIELNVN